MNQAKGEVVAEGRVVSEASLGESAIMGAMIDSENGISARDRSKEIIEDDVACATKDIMDPVERRYEAALVRKQAHKDIRNFLRAVGLEE